MSLQVRLRHPLGDRLIELSPRTADHPILIGRVAGAEVQVPSAAVAPRHSLLFIHQGRWVVQDAGGGQTFVNGQHIQGATFLKVGDVIALGADAKSATVEIDPDGAAEGRSGYVTANGEAPATMAMAAGMAATPQAAPVGRMPGAYPTATPVYGQPHRQVQARPVAQPAQEQPEEASDGDSIAWPSDAPITKSGRFYVPRSKQDQSGAIVAACVIGALIGGVTIWVIASRDADKPVSKPTVINNSIEPKQERPTATQGPQRKPWSIFDDGVVERRDRPEPRVSSNVAEIGVSIGAGRKPTVAVKPAVDPSDPGAAAADVEPSPTEEAEEILERKNDERMKQPQWKSIITAYYSRNPLDALRKIDDYKTSNPGVLTDELNKLREGTLDRLWFERIDQLWLKREEMAARLRELDQALEDEPNEAYRLSTIIPEKNALQRKIDAVNDELVKRMGYTAEEAPLITDEAQLAELRKLRDPEFYANWKNSVINHVHRFGELPFAWEK